MNYEELVKALRICGKGDCVDCDRQRQDKCLKRHWNNENLIDGMLCEAAAAIEALQAELEKKRAADCWGCKCEKVEPKRGEWVVFNKQMLINLENAREQYKELGYPHRTELGLQCSNCRKVTYVDSGIKYEFCPHCGAKMEVQE